jgi:uncharacterized membrane protein YeaQ/YmgE (transglycosylase-associated protein family)
MLGRMGEMRTEAHDLRCSTHPEQPALARCDGCGRALCIECTRWLGRLTGCAHCGELAVPIAPPLAAERPTRVEARRPPSSGWSASLSYPWRGRQRVLTAVIVVELAAMLALERTLQAGGCLFFLPRVLLFLVAVGLMSDVTRHAAEGFDDLTEWPSYSPFTPRVKEALGAGLASLVGFAPAAILFARLDCTRELAAGAGLRLACVVAMVVGLFAGAWLWLPAYVSVARSNEIGAALRIDEHWRLIRALPQEALSTVTLCWLALLAGPTLRSLLPRGSTPGALVEVLFGACGAVVAAHAAGAWAARVEQASGEAR